MLQIHKHFWLDFGIEDERFIKWSDLQENLSPFNRERAIGKVLGQEVNFFDWTTGVFQLRSADRTTQNDGYLHYCECIGSARLIFACPGSVWKYNCAFHFKQRINFFDPNKHFFSLIDSGIRCYECSSNSLNKNPFCETGLSETSPVSCPVSTRFCDFLKVRVNLQLIGMNLTKIS